MISFSYGGRTIRFKGPYSLKKIDSIVAWDHGYLIVLANYAYSDKPIEDYIDLIPILEYLYIDAEIFLDKIHSVEVQYNINAAPKVRRRQ